MQLESPPAPRLAAARETPIPPWKTGPLPWTPCLYLVLGAHFSSSCPTIRPRSVPAHHLAKGFLACSCSLALLNGELAWWQDR